MIPKNFWKTQNLNALLLSSETNRFWYTNFNSSKGMIIVLRNEKRAIAFFDERYIEEAKKEIQNCEIKPLKEFVENWKILTGKIGLEENLKWIIMQKLKNLNSALEFTEINVQALRMIKSSDEILKIKKICQITAQVWKQIVNKVKPGWTEMEVASLIRQQFYAQKVYDLAFPSIVTSDLRSQFIHTTPKNKLIKNHLLCDFGGKWQNYCADFTRVLIFNQQSSIKKIWKLIEKLQKKIIEKIKPGVRISELAKIADEFYLQNNLKQKHALGHGIGLEVHELPNIISNSNIILEEGMVFTIEPGIYLPNIGGVRIEDVILVTSQGHQVLTKT